MREHKETNAQNVSCEGILSVKNAKGIYSKLMEIQRNAGIVITVKNIEQLDSSFLQILILLRLKCIEQKCKINIEIEASMEYDKMLKASGIMNILQENL